MLIYYNGEVIELSNVQLSPFDRGFQFGDGVYEVIRYYPQKFFKYEAHINRLKYSLREMEIPAPDLSNLENILYELINKNGLKDKPAITYLQITRGIQFPRRHIPDNDIKPTFFIYVEKFPIKTNDMLNGVKVDLEKDIRWQRCDIKTIALIPNILSKKRAAAKELFEIIWHRSGIITEGTQTNVFFVKDKLLFTHPLNTNILAGVTRAIIIELCRQFSIQCYEKEIRVDEINSCEEVFLASTTSEVMPVIEIAGTVVGNGCAGPITKFLQNEYSKLHS